MNTPDARRWAGHATGWALLMVFIGYFSNSPVYEHLAPGLATIKLSVRHSGQLLGECHQRSAEELAALPATMRAPSSCPRERAPLQLELDVNGHGVFSEAIAPRGLHQDGMASSYRRLTVPAGDIALAVRMKDHPSQSAFPYRLERRMTLAPAQVLVIDFDSQAGEFVLR